LTDKHAISLQPDFEQMALFAVRRFPALRPTQFERHAPLRPVDARVVV
jgi:hypothetical protein